MSSRGWYSVIVGPLVLYYLIFNFPTAQLKSKSSLNLPTKDVIHRISHQLSPFLIVHVLQVNLIRKIEIVSAKRQVSSRTLKWAVSEKFCCSEHWSSYGLSNMLQFFVFFWDTQCTCLNEFLKMCIYKGKFVSYYISSRSMLASFADNLTLIRLPFSNSRYVMEN